jgi:broad specificity phosphatase PhoE
VKLMRTVLACLLFVGVASTAAAQPTIFVVRHAERADAGMSGAGTMASDPDLSDAGRARAESLARMLKDAGVVAIYTTEFKRTQQTAAPLAKALGIEMVTVPANTPTTLLEALKNARGNVVVVGHSNTVPDLLRGLGVTPAVKIDDKEFDNLFVVTMGPKPTMVRLRFQ